MDKNNKKKKNAQTPRTPRVPNRENSDDDIFSDNVSTKFVPKKSTTAYIPSSFNVNYDTSIDTGSIPPESQASRKKNNLKNSIIVLSVTFILLTIIAIVYFIFFSRKTVDLEEYIKVRYYGTNEYGRIKTIFFSNDMKKLFKEPDSYSKFEQLLKDDYTARAIDGDLKNLKNGDKIKLRFSVPEDWLKLNRIKLKNESFIIEVQGLGDLEEIDPFEYLELKFKNASPYIEAIFYRKGNQDFIRDITYSTSKTTGLSNGDKMLITAEYIPTDFPKIKLSKTEKEIEIKDMPEYVKKFFDCTPALINSVVDIAKDSITTKTKDSTIKMNVLNEYAKAHPGFDKKNIKVRDITPGNAESVSEFLIIPNANEFRSVKNAITVFLKVTYTVPGTEFSQDYYFSTTIENIIKKDDKLFKDSGQIYQTSNILSAPDAEKLYKDFEGKNYSSTIEYLPK